MVRTRDLMLGNWIKYLMEPDVISKPVKIEAIFNQSVEVTNGEDGWDVDESELLGIPITEELLKKCGFKEFRRRGGFVAYSDNGYECGTKLVLDHGDYSLVGINYGLQYLHELQNAYYMLTKKELEICP